MSDVIPHITVCICTFRRPLFLARLLRTLENQETGASFTYSIVVVDNDAQRSSEAVVADFALRGSVAVSYCCEARQNIALARNMAISRAVGTYIAMIDDDEFPETDWIRKMMLACEAHRAAGVLGPVRPHFDEPPPNWIIKGGFCERPEHPTGRIMDWRECRTGNVLFRRSILENVSDAFDPQFGSGGEDQDFFMRMIRLGHVFRWCNEGVAYETVPPSRWTREYMLKRALLRGRNSLRHRKGRAGLLARTAIAVPAYSLILPFTLLLGQHVFMKYCIRFCDHAGRALALIGLNPIRERHG